MIKFFFIKNHDDIEEKINMWIKQNNIKEVKNIIYNIYTEDSDICHYIIVYY